MNGSFFSLLEVLKSGNIVVALNAGNAILRSNFDETILGVDEPKTDVLNIASVWLSYPRPLPTTGKVLLDALWVQNLDVSTIRIKLYDMLGVELRDITDGFHPTSGMNTGIVEFDGNLFPTGIYYVEITGGGYRKAVPIVIAR